MVDITPEAARAERIAVRQRRCRHYEFIFPLGGPGSGMHCKAGVDIKAKWNQREPGIAYRIPCMALNSDKSSCDLCSVYTFEEAERFELERQARIDQMGLASAVVNEIRRVHKGENWAGTVDCPVCGGRLHLRHAAINGHIWGNCDTEGCLRWIE